MSTISVRSPASSREGSFPGKIWPAYKTYQVHRKNRLAPRSLAGLSDHMLKDMGILTYAVHLPVNGRSMNGMRYGRRSIRIADHSARGEASACAE